MKCIACIGSLSASANLRPADAIVTLYNELRINNARQMIKGIFLVSHTTLLLVMEGETSDLALIQYKLRRDERLSDLSVIASSDISHHLFNNWQIRFFKQGSNSHHIYFEKLHQYLEPSLRLHNTLDKQRYSLFLHEQPGANVYALPSSSSATTTAAQGTQDYSDKLFSITAWPKPTQIKLTPRIMRACSLLSSRHIAYSVLLNSHIWETEQLLQQFLDEMNSIGILSTTSGSRANQPLTLADIQPPSESADRFSQLLKKFIAPQKTHAS